MKIMKTARGKSTVKISRKEWDTIGIQAGWIKKEAQNQEGLIPAYHGTLSGGNNEIIQSFRQGANPSGVGMGGQRGGFFAWNDKNKAIQHALSIKNEEIDKAQKITGIPVVVTLMVKLTEENWDIDYEMHGRLLMPFMRKNIELIKKIPNGTITTSENEKIDTQQTKDFGQGILFFGSGMGAIRDKDPSDDQNTSITIPQAARIGAIFDYLQNNYPELTKPIESELFKQIKAIKYIGNDILPVYTIEALVNNQWMDATSQDPPLIGQNPASQQNANQQPSPNLSVNNQQPQNQTPTIAFISNYVGRLS